MDEGFGQQDYSAPQQMGRDQQTFNVLIRELSLFMSTPDDAPLSSDTTMLEVSSEAEHVLRDATVALASARPPNNFAVYKSQEPDGPPAFDGSVANATPPPLGGNFAAGGAGTLLHLACALDRPLALAFLLAMGADARACHTAFRRLMIHEAACNGSIHCLTLLLEQGRKHGDVDGDARTRPGEVHLPFLPRKIHRDQASMPMRLFAAHPELISIREKENSCAKLTLSLMHLFRDLSQKVRQGSLDELAAARHILDHASLEEHVKASLARSCGYTRDALAHRTFLRNGNSDGHGNTPLHWAAFKNETECVALLLKYNADANARAHPSGWTPLHDAAYSNSEATIELLINAGAVVDARANSGATPLCFAAQEDAAEAACLLLRHGADLSARCAGGPIAQDGAVQPGAHSRFSGYTPLHYCAHYNAQRAAGMLLQHHSARHAMEVPDLSDRLPIHVSVARGSSGVLHQLLHAGVRVETRFSNKCSVKPQAPADEAERNLDPVSPPRLRSLIPAQPVNSSKPWNCLTQQSIDECQHLISEAEQNWTVQRHQLFTPCDRRAVAAVLKVGKRLEQEDVIFIDLWPTVLTFCGRGWFEDGNVNRANGSDPTLYSI